MFTVRAAIPIIASRKPSVPTGTITVFTAARTAMVIESDPTIKPALAATATTPIARLATAQK